MATVPAGKAVPLCNVRPRELEDGLNHFVYHPLASRLARLLLPTGISPNAVSVTGGLLIWGAAWAYTQFGWPLSVAIGLALHLSWHVVDGADGDLARMSGKSSPTGELVDGVCDYAGHAVLYIALAAMLDDMIGLWAWPLGVVAAASHIAQTNHAETQRRAYKWWVYDIPWLKHARAADHAVFQGRDWFSFAFGWMAAGYLKLAGAMTPVSARIDAAHQAAAGNPAQANRLRRLARVASRRSLAYQKLLGPNPRTIILGASMAAGSPLYFFLAEVVLLNLLLVVSVRHHNSAGRRLAERLG